MDKYVVIYTYNGISLVKKNITIGIPDTCHNLDESQHNAERKMLDIEAQERIY